MVLKHLNGSSTTPTAASGDLAGKIGFHCVQLFGRHFRQITFGRFQQRFR